MEKRITQAERTAFHRVWHQLRPALDWLEQKEGECLHLKPGAPLRARIAGDLVRLPGGAFQASLAEGIVRELLSPSQQQIFQEKKSLECSIPTPEGGRLRCRLLRQRGSVEILLRPVPQSIKDFAALDLPEELQEVHQLSSGLVLVAGPAGHGKSTTLAAIVQHLNSKRACHILCIESPSEFVHLPQLALVDQIEVGQDAESQVSALRAIPRQDAEVVLVERPQSEEAIEILLNLCESGHLVLTSVDARTTRGALDWWTERVTFQEEEVFRERILRQLQLFLFQVLLSRRNRKESLLCSHLLRRGHGLEGFSLEAWMRSSHQIAAWRSSESKHPSAFDSRLIQLCLAGETSWEEALAFAMDRAALERAMLFEA